MRFLLAIVATTTILASSCEPNLVDDFSEIPEKWDSIEEFYSSVDLSRKVRINEISDEFVIDIENTLYYFKPNSIKQLNGEPAGGEAIFHYDKLNKSGDVILHGIDTRTFDDELLQISTIIDFSFTQNDQKLILAKPITFYLNENEGKEDDSTFEYFDDGTNIGWNPTIGFNIQSTDWDFEIGSEQYNGSGYKMKVEKDGFNLLGNFEKSIYPNLDDYETLKITIPEEFDNNKTRVYLMYNNIICTSELFKTGQKYIRSEVLKNTEVTAIAITIKDQALYFGKKSFIVGEDNEYSLSLSETNFSKLLDELKAI